MKTTSRICFATLCALSAAGAFAQSQGPSPACGKAAGTQFNLEPRVNPLPQQQTAVDFLPGAASGSDLIVGVANDMRLLTSASASAPDFRGLLGLTSQGGFYVHRNGANSNPCAPDLEGGLAPLVNAADNAILAGTGYAAVAADPQRQAFFIADTRVGINEGSDSAIGLFRTTAANLLNTTACPDGTLTEEQFPQCWPTAVLVNLNSIFTAWNSSPHLAVDERPIAAGTGAGNVYVSATQLLPDAPFSRIVLTTCKNDLSACSAPVPVSGSDSGDLSRVAVRPDGGVTLTYVAQSGGAIGIPEKADIKYVTCTPRGAPRTPSCAPATLIQSETQAIPFDFANPHTGLSGTSFVMHTFAKHAHRQDANGIETYVVWERCKVSTAVTYPGLTFVNLCPDSDLVMAVSNDNGQTWQFADVDAGPQHQFQASVATDPSNNIVNIAYYSTGADPLQHRPQVLLRQILPGSSTPDPVGDPQVITTLAMEPNGDPVLQGIFIGDYLGIAARSGRAYIHHTHTAASGIYSGQPDPEQNNHLSRFDY